MQVDLDFIYDKYYYPYDCPNSESLIIIHFLDSHQSLRKCSSIDIILYKIPEQGIFKHQRLWKCLLLILYDICLFLS